MVAPKPQDYDVIVSPIITEKATRILENNQVVFKIDKNYIINEVSCIYNIIMVNISSIKRSVC